MRPRPPTLLLAAAVQGVEAAGLLAAAVLSAVDTAAGRSYERSSGIALTVIAFGAVGIVAFIAWGIYRVRRWSRTPALLTQLFVGTTGVYLLEGHRLDWGVPGPPAGDRRLYRAPAPAQPPRPGHRAGERGARGGSRPARRPASRQSPRQGHPGRGAQGSAGHPPGSPGGQDRPPVGQEGILAPPLTAARSRPTRRW